MLADLADDKSMLNKDVQIHDRRRDVRKEEERT